MNLSSSCKQPMLSVSIKLMSETHFWWLFECKGWMRRFIWSMGLVDRRNEMNIKPYVDLPKILICTFQVFLCNRESKWFPLKKGQKWSLFATVNFCNIFFAKVLLQHWREHRDLQLWYDANKLPGTRGGSWWIKIFIGFKTLDTRYRQALKKVNLEMFHDIEVHHDIKPPDATNGATANPSVCHSLIYIHKIDRLFVVRSF